MPEPTQVKHLLGASPQGRLLALTTNNRLGWKGLPGINNLAYYGNPEITAVISFMMQAPCK
jgi:hypothetical protein